MLWGKAKLQGAESDSRGAADLLPPEPLFGYETLLSGVSALTPNEQSKHRYTCTVNTFTHCWFAIMDAHSCNKMVLVMHKQSSSFCKENCLGSVVLDHTCQKEPKSFESLF